MARARPRRRRRRGCRRTPFRASWWGRISPSGFAHTPTLFVTEAGHDVVVHQARRLHEGVDDHRADELEALFLQGLRELVALRRGGRHVAPAAPAVLDRATIDRVPAEGRKVL